ncbi:protein of unknown function DUF74 [Bacillus amyloliquefaciens]|nr:protein of unknown function DUF74 [Bacillus amyloliquefaciens]
MIMTTTETIAGKQITEVKGLVTSSIVQSRHIGKDLLAGLKSVVGGELKSYTEMLEDSKKAVKERLIREAEQLGANAIVGLRFELTAGQNTSELIGYGTAVTAESIKKTSLFKEACFFISHMRYSLYLGQVFYLHCKALLIHTVCTLFCRPCFSLSTIWPRRPYTPYSAPCSFDTFSPLFSLLPSAPLRMNIRTQDRKTKAQLPSFSFLSYPLS